ncbi:MAG: TonB-dependent receptor [Bacteroidales bacterium]|nr:TonB-dependent receptor [Bacteroidales bacterium]
MKKNVFVFVFALLISALSFGQVSQVTGVVSADDGSPLPGASVFIKGTTTGVVTDLDGKYALNVSGTENPVLVFSYVGYLTEEIAVGNQAVIDVMLASDIQSLDEIVVVGYGVTKKSLVTGSIAKVVDEDINQTKNLRLEQALQGKVSGVMISQNSGSPGADMTVRIRGISSNSTSSPLFVVDGIKVGGIQDLNPNDIASVEILKDAASAAIYGSEAANGVVLVTTKKGDKGKKGTASYNGYYGVNSPTQMPDVLTAEDYVKYFKEAHLHEAAYARWKRGIVRSYDEPALIEAVNTLMPYDENVVGKGTNWLDEILEPASVQSHNLQFYGGTESSSYFLSAGYYDENGIIGGPKSKFKRYTFDVSGEHSVNEWLEVSAKLNYVYRNTKNIGMNDEFGGVISMAANLDPLTPVFEADPANLPTMTEEQLALVPRKGDLYYGLSHLVTNEVCNPLAWMDQTHENYVQNKVLGKVGARAKIIKGLTYNPSMNFENWHGYNHGWRPAYYFHGLKNDPKSIVSREAQTGIKVFFDQFLNYENTVGKHSFNAMVGQSYEHYNNIGMGANNRKILYENDAFAFLSQAQDTVPNVWDWAGEDVMISYFGRLSYNYDEKLMFTFNYRADGSNKFGTNNRFGKFPSVSAGYVISRESFWNVPVVNFMKVRGSWGRNGSTSNLGGFDWTSTLSFGDARYPFGTAIYNGARPTRSSNPDLRWEQSEQYNFGLDAGFLSNRIFLTADYFIKTTIDLLVDGTPPLYTGNRPPVVNAGNIQNKGVELDLGINQKAGDFNYSIALNASYLKNEVIKLTDEIKELIGASVGIGQGNVNKFEEGYPVWYFWGYETDGFFKDTAEIRAHADANGVMLQPNAIPGDVKFRDVGGVDSLGNKTNIPDGIINENDKVMLGQPFPKWTYGLNITCEYKGFDFAMLWQAVTGNSIYNGTYRSDLKTNNKPQKFWDERWDYTNPTADNGWMRPTYTDNNTNYRPSDLFVEDGSYLKLRQLMLGYTLPKSFTEKIKISKLRLYVSADNILTITNYSGGDPEIGQVSGWAANVGIDRGFYPSAKSYKFGVNVNF